MSLYGDGGNKRYVHGDCKRSGEVPEVEFEFTDKRRKHTIKGEVRTIDRSRKYDRDREEITLVLHGTHTVEVLHATPHFRTPSPRIGHTVCVCSCPSCLVTPAESTSGQSECICEGCSCQKK